MENSTKVWGIFGVTGIEVPGGWWVTGYLTNHGERYSLVRDNKGLLLVDMLTKEQLENKIISYKRKEKLNILNEK